MTDHDGPALRQRPQGRRLSRQQKKQKQGAHPLHLSREPPVEMLLYHTLYIM